MIDYTGNMHCECRSRCLPIFGVNKVSEHLTHSNNVAFDIETSHLFCRAKQMTGFYIKRNTGLKRVYTTRYF